MDEYGIDHSHFTGQRRWSDRALADAVAASRTWTEVTDALGLQSASGTSRGVLLAHATRLGLDVSHLGRRQPAGLPAYNRSTEARFLPQSGSLLAASWFSLRGYRVSWPLEPCRYDLLIDADGQLSRIQVKTTTRRMDSSWAAQIGTSRRHGMTVYEPGEIEDFFVIDGDLRYYLIPYGVVAGYQTIMLNHYARFALDNSWTTSAEARASPAP